MEVEALRVGCSISRCPFSRGGVGSTGGVGFVCFAGFASLARTPRFALLPSKLHLPSVSVPGGERPAPTDVTRVIRLRVVETGGWAPYQTRGHYYPLPYRIDKKVHCDDIKKNG